MNPRKVPPKRPRRSKGTAWHWQQTDCWYCTLPGTKQRVPLFDENGQRIRGRDNREAAELALARLKLSADDWPAGTAPEPTHWVVAHVCSEHLQYCERGVATGRIS